MAGNRAQRLSGINPLAYLGVEPSTPPLLVVSSNSPTENDSNGFFLGSIWVVTPSSFVSSPVYEIWFLVALFKGVATWVQIFPSAGSGAVDQFTTQAGTNPVVPDVNGNINISGTGSISGLLTTSGSLNTIDLVVGGALAAHFVTNSGTAIPALNVLTIVGTSVLTTTGTGSTVDLGFTTATNLQVIGGVTSGVPTWQTLTSTGGSVAITKDGNTINFEATGTDVGAVTFATDSGNATVDMTTITIHGGSNINTSGATSIVTINLNNSIVLPATTANALNGVISIGSNRYLHAYQGVTNVFVGNEAGNFTMSSGATDNVALGDTALNALTSGSNNCIIGALAGATITSGTNNIALGGGAASSYTTESSNITIGNVGTVADANTIRIGTQGSSGQQQNKCFIAGITGVTTSNSNYVTVNTSTGQLGATTVSPVGVAGTQSFSYYQATTNTVTITTSPTLNYNMGSGIAFTSLFDNSGGAFFPGDGAGTGAFFVAVADGIYQFMWQLVCIRAHSGSGTVNAMQQLNMNFQQTGSVTQSWSNTFPGIATTLSSVSGSGFSQMISWSNTVLVPMIMGDTIEFNVQDNSTAVTYNFRGSDMLNGAFGNYIQGYRVA